MKKLLALMMAMVMAMAMAACGGDEVAEDPVDEPAVEETISAEDPLLGTWDFCGGMFGDAELTEEEAIDVLNQYGGVLQFVFNEDGTVAMVQGGGSLEGTFVSQGEKGGIATFDYDGGTLEYVCELIDFEGTLVMTATQDNVDYMYFIQM